jgi:hypothetical protein
MNLAGGHPIAPFRFQFFRQSAMTTARQRKICSSGNSKFSMDDLRLVVGFALLLIVIACGWLLGKKANENVRKFRSDQHQSFRRRNEP